MAQWYRQMVKAMNKKLKDHQGYKKDEDFPLTGRDKKISDKIDNPKGTAKPIAPAKKPASTIDMDWIKEQKQKLKG